MGEGSMMGFRGGDFYCALILYLYMGEIKIAVSPGEFALACLPGQKICSACRQRHNSMQDASTSSPVGEACSAARDVAGTMKPWTTWKDMLLVAHVYGLEPLRRTCRDEITTYLQLGWVLAGLFDCGYRFSHLRN